MIREGNVCIELPNFLDQCLLDDLIEFTKKNLEALTKKEFKNKENELISRILQNNEFQKLTEKYASKSYSLLIQNKTTNINCKSSFVKTDTELHYDKCYLNWVIPLILEKNKEPGLIIFPNSRKNLFKFFGLKLIVILFGSPLVLRSKIFMSLFGGEKIEYRVNHAYIFDGYNSLHGVVRQVDDGNRCVITINFRMPD